jgi:hypothetical protein
MWGTGSSTGAEGMMQKITRTVVQCAHCGRIFSGDSQAGVWFEAMNCADSHQVKTYTYAPELRPPRGIATGPEPIAEP